MTFASDDLGPVLAPPGGEFVGYGQGVLIQFDNETFENVVLYRGAKLTNLSVLDRVGALTYKPGDVVLLMRWSSTGKGLSSIWIAGVPVVPGAGRAEEAIAFLSTSLAANLIDDIVEQLLTSPAGEELAAFVLGQRVHAANTSGAVVTSSNSFVSLTGGPTVSNVSVSDAGLALVWVGAVMDSSAVDVGLLGSIMSFAVSGATTLGPTSGRSVQNGQSVSVVGSSWSHRTSARTMMAHVVSLNPGTHTFEARYASQVSGQSTTFADRTLIVMAF